ncbi:MAG: hypothetical protein MJZ28_08355, partial [Paludibacteraceae bacterium]|nr:hypothetical protein [Paludibacteraceae bacterium]
MKRILLGLTLFLYAFTTSFAASPQLISYQAVVRNEYGEIVKGSNIGLKISILSNGKCIYSETRTEKTNQNGLLAFSIGNGESDSAMDKIDWSKGEYSLRCEMDLDGGNDYALSMETELTSVPYALYAESVSPDALPSKVSQLENDANYITISQLDKAKKEIIALIPTKQATTDSILVDVNLLKITAKDTAKWNAKMDVFSETDPIFMQSVAAKISASDTAKWNAKLDEFTETDPIFKQSVAAKISASDTAKWNAKLDDFTESDPIFKQSVAAKISANDTAKWNAKLDDFTETDPIFKQSVAAKISANDTAKWNAKLDDFTESDPIFKQSVAAKISASDTAKW